MIEAQKTIAYEVAEQFGVPDWFIVSMGSGGTIYSMWKGFKELHELGMTKKLPRMVGVQAEGCSPIVDDYLGIKKKSIEPTTHAIGILVANPLQRRLAVHAITESRGLATLASDQEIFVAEQEVARMEGMFAEPASSGTIAALRKLRSESVIAEDDTVVCLITGSGLKATDVLQALSKRRKTAAVGAEFSTKEKILRILEKRDAYGYELWKALGKTMTRSAVYQHLNEFSARGLASSYLKAGRRYFTITVRGRRVLRAIDEIKVIM